MVGDWEETLGQEMLTPVVCAPSKLGILFSAATLDSSNFAWPDNSYLFFTFRFLKFSLQADLSSCYFARISVVWQHIILNA